MKLGKFLAEYGTASRRRSKELVAEGRVRVNGQKADSPGSLIDPEKDVIEVDGERIRLDLDTEKVYILLNKPAGYLSTTTDPEGRKTIMDLLPPIDGRIYPVGRLDMDSEGLLMITNDGDMTYRLTHPKHHVDKVYLVWVSGRPTDESLEKLRRGIVLEDGLTAPAIIKRDNRSGPGCIKMVIHEGRKRQIKRMFTAIGHRVQRLKRIQLGPIRLGNLPLGDYRYLSQKEVEALERATGSFKEEATCPPFE